MNKCGHDDCFTCPFPDCIINDTCERVTDTPEKPKKKRTWRTGRKPMDMSEKAQRKREASKRYYYKHKNEINERHLANYYKRKEKEKQA